MMLYTIMPVTIIIFLIKEMKALAVILLLAFSGAGSAANMTQSEIRTSSPSPSPSPSPSSPPFEQCNITNSSDSAEVDSRCVNFSSPPEQLCTYNCFGYYYNTSDFPSSCVSQLVDLCRAAGVSNPFVCSGTSSNSGALALSAIKELLVAVLLLAALIVA